MKKFLHLLMIVISTFSIHLLLNTPSKFTTQLNSYILKNVTISKGQKLVFTLNQHYGTGDMIINYFSPNLTEISTKSQNNLHLKSLEILNELRNIDFTITVQGKLGYNLLAFFQKDKKIIDVEESIPIFNKIEKDQYIYFKYDCEKNEQFEISSSVFFGSIDSFFSFTSPPTKEKFTQMKHSYESTTYIITCSKPETIYIGLYGLKSSLFQITFIKRKENFILSEGVPIFLSLKDYEFNFFKYYILKSDQTYKFYFTDIFVYNCPLTIKGSNKPLVGDMKKDSILWKKNIFTNDDDDTFTIDKNDPYYKLLTPGTIIYFMVESTCKEPVHYIIQSRKNNNILLLNKFPFKYTESISKENYIYFLTYMNDDEVDDVVLVPTSGNNLNPINIYASKKPQPDEKRFDFKGSIIGGSTVLNVPNKDISMLFLAVHIVEKIHSNFSITLYDEDGMNPVYALDMAPITMKVDFVKYKSFVIEIDHFQNYDVEIRCFTIKGDVALFVSTIGIPTKDNFEWRSNIPGSNVENIVSILSSDRRIDGVKFNGHLYISVYGYDKAGSYITIQTSYREQIHHVLNTKLTVDTVLYHDTKFFKYQFPYDGKSSIHLDAYEGVCYSSLLLSKEHKPTSSKSIWFKNLLNETECVEFDNSKGVFYIGVEGFSEKCKFSLVMNENYGIFENYGNYYGYVFKNECRKFKLPIVDTFTSKIKLTSTLVSGDISTYVLKGAVPTPQHFDKKDESYLGNYLEADNSVATYWISICGKEDSTYFLHSSYKDDVVLKMDITTPTMIVATTQIKYIKTFAPTNKISYRFGILANDDDIDVFIDQQPNPTQQKNKWKASIKSYHYSTIEIGKTEVELQTFFIGIQSKTKNTKVYIILQEGDEAFYIHSQNMMNFGQVKNDQLFKFYSNEYQTPLNLRIDSCNDSPVLPFYIKDHLDSNGYDFVSDHSASHGFSQIVYSKEKMKKSTRYYVVPEKGKQSMSLSADLLFVDDLRPRLKDSSVLYYITNNKVKLVFENVISRSGGVTYRVMRRKLSNKITQEQLKRVNLKTACSLVDQGEFVGTAKTEKDNYLSYDIDLLEPKNIEGFGILPLDVHGFGEVYDDVYPAVLMTGQSKHAIVEKDQKAHFIVPQVENHLLSKKYLFSITKYSGHAEMYVSLDENVSEKDYLWKTDEFGIIEIDLNETNPQAGSYFVCVHGVQSTEFVIHNYFDSSEEIIVDDGKPIILKTNKITNLLYRLNSPAGNNSLSISIAPVVDNPDITIRDENGDIISLKESTFEVIELPKGPTKDYHVSISSSNTKDSVYYVSLSSKDSIEMLVEGIPIGKKLKKGEYHFFQYRLLEKVDFVVSLTSILGNQEIFVSTTNQHPSRDDHQFSSSSGNLKITNSQITVYYVGILGTSESFFHISVVLDETVTMLLNGLPKMLCKGEKKSFKFYHEKSLSNSLAVSYPTEYFGDNYEFDCKKNGKDIKSVKIGSISVVDLRNEKSDGMVECSTVDKSTDGNDFMLHLKSQEYTTVLNGLTSYYHTVKEGSFKFFVVYPENEDVTFSIFPIVGDIRFEIFDSKKEEVLYKSVGSVYYYSNIHQEKKLFIGVYGIEKDVDNQFNIVFQNKKLSPLLLNPSSYYITKKQKTLYLNLQEKDTKSINFNLHSLTNFIDSSFTIIDKTTKTNSIDYGNQFLELEQVTSNKIQMQAGSIEMSNVLISGGNDFEYISKNGYSLIKNVKKNSVVKFQTYIEEDDQIVVFSILSIVGNKTRILVNPSSDFPTTKEYIYQTNKKHLSVPRDDKHFKIGVWSFTVESGEDSVFWLSIHTSNHVKLSYGKPVMGSYANNYFSVNIEKEDAVFFNLKEIREYYDLNCLNVYISQEYMYPNENNAKWRFAFNGTTQTDLGFEVRNMEKNKMMYLQIKGSKGCHRTFILRIFNSQNYLQERSQVLLGKKEQIFHFYTPTIDNEQTLKPIIYIDSCENEKVDESKVNLGLKYEVSLSKNNYSKSLTFISEVKGNFVYKGEISNTKGSYSAYYSSHNLIPKNLEISLSRIYTHDTFHKKSYLFKIDLSSFNLKGKVYDLRIIESHKDIRNKNYHTTCAVKRLWDYHNMSNNAESKAYRFMLTNDNTKQDKEEQTVEFLVTDLNPLTYYAVNLIVYDSNNEFEYSHHPSFFYTDLTKYYYISFGVVLFALCGLGLYCAGLLYCILCCKCFQRKTLMEIKNPSINRPLLDEHDEVDNDDILSEVESSEKEEIEQEDTPYQKLESEEEEEEDEKVEKEVKVDEKRENEKIKEKPKPVEKKPVRSPQLPQEPLIENEIIFEEEDRLLDSLDVSNEIEDVEEEKSVVVPKPLLSDSLDEEDDLLEEYGDILDDDDISIPLNLQEEELKKIYKMHEHKEMYVEKLIQQGSEFPDEIMEYQKQLAKLTPALVYEISWYKSPVKEILDVLVSAMMTVGFIDSVKKFESKKSLIRAHPLLFYHRIIRFNPRGKIKIMEKADKELKKLLYVKAKNLALPAKLLFCFVKLSLYFSKQ